MNTDAKFIVRQRPGMVEAVNKAFSTRTTYGRARRSEFWWFLLFYFLCDIFESIIALFIALSMPDSLYLKLRVFFWVYMVLISFLVTVRRLHDIGKNATWAVLGIVVIGKVGVI